MKRRSKPPRTTEMRVRQAPRKSSRLKAPVKTSRSKTPTAKRSVSKSSRDKVQAYRDRMRAKGFRLYQMWLPDTRTPEFAAEARRQCQLVNNSPFAAEDQAWVDSMIDWKID